MNNLYNTKEIKKYTNKSLIAIIMALCIPFQQVLSFTADSRPGIFSHFFPSPSLSGFSTFFSATYRFTQQTASFASATTGALSTMSQYTSIPTAFAVIGLSSILYGAPNGSHVATLGIGTWFGFLIAKHWPESVEMAPSIKTPMGNSSFDQFKKTFEALRSDYINHSLSSNAATPCTEQNKDLKKLQEESDQQKERRVKDQRIKLEQAQEALKKAQTEMDQKKQAIVKLEELLNEAKKAEKTLKSKIASDKQINTALKKQLEEQQKIIETLEAQKKAALQEQLRDTAKQQLRDTAKQTFNALKAVKAPTPPSELSTTQGFPLSTKVSNFPTKRMHCTVNAPNISRVEQNHPKEPSSTYLFASEPTIPAEKQMTTLEHLNGARLNTPNQNQKDASNSSFLNHCSLTVPPDIMRFGLSAMKRGPK